MRVNVVLYVKVKIVEGRGRMSVVYVCCTCSGVTSGTVLVFSSTGMSDFNAATLIDRDEEEEDEDEEEAGDDFDDFEDEDDAAVVVVLAVLGATALTLTLALTDALFFLSLRDALTSSSSFFAASMIDLPVVLDNTLLDEPLAAAFFSALVNFSSSFFASFFSSLISFFVSYRTNGSG